jgi:hypothetical protein
MARLIAVSLIPPHAKLRLHLVLTNLGFIADRRWLCVILVGFAGFAGSLAVGLLVGISEPKFHDEFSYLLAGDTFARGRLTNPTHPMWVHFESFHIIHQPTYMSKYPPAQGLALAAGQVIGGHPIVGVWLSFGLMCAAICWMLYTWVPPRWAILGAVLALINPMLGVAGYWAQSYWGGAVAAMGGALVLGGIKRLMRRPQVSDSLLTGAGLAILANSRPFEGLLVSLPAGIFLFLHIINQRGQALWLSIRRIVVPIVIVLALAIVGMGFYNLRVTGNPLRMPHQLHEETYGMVHFLWQKLPAEPEYRHKVIRDFHTTYALFFYTSQRSVSGFLVEGVYPVLSLEFRTLNIFLIPVIIAFPVLVPWMLRNRWATRALLIYFVSVFGLLTETFKWPHYLAPVIGLNYYFVSSAMRLLCWHKSKIALLLIWLTPLLALAALVASLYASARKDSSTNSHIQRAQLIDQLKRDGGQHLVVVNYGPEHSVHNEWVYNEADIDRAKVVFARAMNSKQDCQLLEYFKSRRIWSLEVDGDQSIPKLKSYPMNLCDEKNDLPYGHLSNHNPSRLTAD